MASITRSFDLVRPELRKSNDEEASGPGTFVGHASVFNQRTLIGSRDWGFIEEIAPGAFDDVLNDDVRFLFNHDGQPLARTSNGTLVLSVDKEGLRNEAVLADTTLGRDVALLVARGDLTQQSFAFTVARDGASWSVLKDDDTGMEMDLRTVNKIERLYDTSVVTYPAYEGATGNLRFQPATADEVNNVLRDVRSERENAQREQDLHDAKRDGIMISRNRNLLLNRSVK